MPDLLDASLPRDKTCLITNDGTPLAPELVSRLKNDGWTRIIVLSFPISMVPAIDIDANGAESILLADTADSTIAEKIQQIRQTHGSIGAFIHLHPSFKFDLSGQERFNDIEKQLLKAVFMLAKHLAAPLHETGIDQRSLFFTVTRSNGLLGLQPEKVTSPVAGGLNGLLKTAGIEWNSVFCRAVDLSLELKAPDAAKAIMTEMSDSDCRISEIGCTAKKRLTLVAEGTPIDLSGVSGIDEKSVFIVAGGGKGVTAACVMEMARRFGSRFIILGRSELQESEPDWAIGCEDDKELKRRCMESMKAAGEKPTPMKIAGQIKMILSDREIRNTVSEIQSAGGKAVYLTVDIQDSKALKKALRPAIDQLGDITGVIHGAGVLADTLIEKKTEADFEAVYNTKVSGLNSMLNAVSLEKLSHLVLFSSAAGFYGNEAQSDYAAANEILNKFAHQFKQQFPSCHVIAYNWGPWDGGMVTPELKKIFEQRHVDIIPVPAGAEMMAEGLDMVYRDTPQAVIGSSMTVSGKLDEHRKSWTIKRTLSLDGNPFLLDHAIDQEPVLPFIAAVSWMADGCARLYPGYFLNSVEKASVFKGVVFTGISEKDFSLEISELEKDEAAGRIYFDVRISSPGPEGKSVFHYGSQVILSRDPVPAARISPAAGSLPGRSVEYYTNGTLFHGPVFRNITGLISIDEEKLVISCRTPQASETTHGQFITDLFNFFAEDTCLQALLIWARHFQNAGSLPLKIQKAEFFRPIPFETDFLITLTPEVSNASKLSATVIAHSVSGEIYSRFSGAEATISKNLDGKF